MNSNKRMHRKNCITSFRKRSASLQTSHILGIWCHGKRRLESIHQVNDTQPE